MKTTRFLLPFVHGVDKFAIEQAILLAKSHQATLVPIVLIHVPEERRRKGVRLEYLQQSKDFLETVKRKADRYAVQIERLEVITSDVVKSINLVATEMECEGILLFLSQKGGILLSLHDIKRLMEMPVSKLYVLHLPTKERANFVQEMRRHFSDWLHRRSEEPGRQSIEHKRVDEELGLSLKS